MDESRTADPLPVGDADVEVPATVDPDASSEVPLPASPSVASGIPTSVRSSTSSSVASGIPTSVRSGTSSSVASDAASPAVPPSVLSAESSTVATGSPTPRRTILMDFDGVIVREDSLGAFLRHTLTGAPWRLPGFLAATSALVPLIGLPATRSRGLKLLLRAGFAGLSHDRYRETAAAFGTDLAARPGALLEPGVDAARAHLADGDRVVVVTGSEETLARAVLDAAGLQDAELIGSRIGPTPFGLAFEVHAYGPAKVVELRERGIAPPWDVAYSDSSADLPMLAGARSAVLVNVGARGGARVRSALPGRVTDVVWT